MVRYAIANAPYYPCLEIRDPPCRMGEHLFVCPSQTRDTPCTTHGGLCRGDFVPIPSKSDGISPTLLGWYPQPDRKAAGDLPFVIAPDVMVVLGRPKGKRGSYKQWEENGIPHQVVFEILSPGNRAQEMADKLRFFQRYGVQEYYLYDPERNSLL